MEQSITSNRGLLTGAPSDRVIVVTHPPGDVVREQVRRLNRRAEAFIAENPVLSLAIALTFGVILGWLIKRR